jgi:Domain of unknown function (DUF1737)
MGEPPDGLPRCRLLTGKDDATFCNRVNEALKIGYELYGPGEVMMVFWLLIKGVNVEQWEKRALESAGK